MTWHVLPRPYRDEARLLCGDEIRAVFYGPHAIEDAEHCVELLNADEGNR